MSTKITGPYKEIIGKDGKVKIILDQKAIEAKLNVSLRLKRATSKKITVKRGRS
jgi:hypothetical protein